MEGQKPTLPGTKTKIKIGTALGFCAPSTLLIVWH